MRSAENPPRVPLRICEPLFCTRANRQAGTDDQRTAGDDGRFKKRTADPSQFYAVISFTSVYRGHLDRVREYGCMFRNGR